MNFEAWTVDLASSSAVHATGFKVAVEGDLRNPSGVHPGKFPEGLTAMEQARLLRCGLEAIVKLAQNQGFRQDQARFTERAKAAPTASAPAAVPARKPTRPILSLKK